MQRPAGVSWLAVMGKGKLLPRRGAWFTVKEFIMPIKPEDMILRCMAHRTARGTWVAKCIDFDLATEEASLEEAKQDLLSMMTSYIDAVYDTEDQESIPALLLRKGPWYDRLIFNILSLINHRPNNHHRDRVMFQQAIPMHLGAVCH